MIPTNVDQALLREHAYLNNNDLSEVLDPTVFSNNDGFKSIKEYGLGYFNYYLALDSDIYDASSLDILRAHIYDNFNIYLGLFLILMVFWGYNIVNGLGGLNSMFKKRRWNRFGDSGIEYHHVKV
ncbi:similar to Saccharomyces cerevisiae YCR043C Putative protein of unknown function [Maudiozyma saulgeensis]|uniref:Uncharacterized protein n=1 Tax=Maudiozyma saulgeensis TaxID=1789683 RepID=A0A1X7R3N3_9SACH|nr:similar to Saccharomyces cerevisiae YCR043C Putative protein of unknown function [Kazachstania saulgeensis]